MCFDAAEEKVGLDGSEGGGAGSIDRNSKQHTERGAADAPSRYVLPTYVCKQVLNEIKTEHRVSGMRDEYESG